ncbi:hypothetical protein EYC80_005082 [Monilinia laxa]|uniref:CID domain-containing protein n=1 Tax=Monilinia laxa TaxID=61186 RepID=A0A5N6KIT8_MONLA|nr:hypothetical protein EYC80_005082 [Monilinia laxa]
MSSAVAELEAGLQAMVQLRPPGVSGSRIQGLTNLCTQNIQQESALVQKLFIHFKKTPPTHKLGTLYVVDSVTRKWTEQAKIAGQTINSSAPDGTYAAGVHKVKELLPALMNDIIQSAPDDQKDKIRKLVDIWEKGQTFPLQMLNGFKEKLNAPNDTTTPPGSPPSNIQATLGLQGNPSTSTMAPAQPTSSAPPNTSSILAALANMANTARQNPTPTPVSSAPPVNSYNVSHAQNNPIQPAQAMNQSLPFSVAPQPVNVPAPSMPAYGQAPSNGIPNFASNPNPFQGVAPPINPPGNLDPGTQQQVTLIKALAATGVPAEQIAGILAAMNNQAAAGVPPPFAQNQNTHPQNNWGAGARDDTRDRNGFHDSMRSPPGRYRRRSRSPSPQRGWGGRDSPNARRRDDFDRESPARMRGSDDRGRTGRGRGNEYRQRSPQRRRSNTPPRANAGGPKWVGHDSQIPKGNIKVLSRTLFVGGVTCSEHELKGLFNQYGDVQTCIVNKEKRHAFVKMVSREHALNAKEAMEKNRSPDSSLRTRWGVGFGPRDCSDYQTGISIIPISKLTDADRKWMLNAEFGGSGGQEIESGMVVEEPDIEIGQGVSSKAISRRLGTDNGGKGGLKYEEDDRPRYRRDREDRRDDRRDESHKFPANTVPPVMPPFPLGAFPYPLPTLPNGMPMFPPGFTFPGQQPNTQPPPPGHNPS